MRYRQWPSTDSAAHLRDESQKLAALGLLLGESAPQA